MFGGFDQSLRLIRPTKTTNNKKYPEDFKVELRFELWTFSTLYSILDSLDQKFMETHSID